FSLPVELSERGVRAELQSLFDLSSYSQTELGAIDRSSTRDFRVKASLNKNEQKVEFSIWQRINPGQVLSELWTGEGQEIQTEIKFSDFDRDHRVQDIFIRCQQ